MKKSAYILLLAILTTLFFQAKAQQSGFRINVGYALATGSPVINEEYVSPFTNSTVNTAVHYRAMSGTFGTGLHAGLSYVRMFSKHVGFEFNATYQSGTSYVNWIYPDVSYVLENNVGSPYFSEGQSSTKSDGFYFSPMLIFQPSSGKAVQPYLKAGVVSGNINMAFQSTENNIETNSGIATETRVSQHSSGSTFGFRAGMGMLIRMGKRTSFFTELLFTRTQFHPVTSALAQYSVNGTNLVEGTRENQVVDPTGTINHISSYPMVNVMVNVGIQFRIGRAY
ncbi:hypothetical protein BH10BAC4_BH10BAC4_19370 [soil metagenome]